MSILEIKQLKSFLFDISIIGTKKDIHIWRMILIRPVALKVRILTPTLSEFEF